MENHESDGKHSIDVLDVFRQNTAKENQIVSAKKEQSSQSQIRQIVRKNNQASDTLYRSAEALEFEPEAVFMILEYLQQSYVSQVEELAEERLLVSGDQNYVAFALSGYEWYHLVQSLTSNTKSKPKSNRIIQTTLEVLKKLAGDTWSSQYAIIIGLPEERVDDVVERQRKEYGRDHPCQWERV